MRFSVIARIAALAAIIVPFASAAPTQILNLRNVNATDVIPDSYIVVFKKTASADTVAKHHQGIASYIGKHPNNKRGVGPKYAVEGFQGYQIETDSTTIASIASLPEVDYIEKDAKASASILTTQIGSQFNLGRISHRKPLISNYVYDSSAGRGTTVYIVDTGIYTTHTQFAGRAVWGANFVSGSPNTDENGHGTHCAGTAAGTTYGVSKLASLVAVKVLDINGSGSYSGVISGIQWVANDAKSKGISAKSVLSMSLGGPYSAALNSAVASAVSSGVTVVVAAGNSNIDAGSTSPASEPSAITVGATTSTDQRASFSNFGGSLDLFAPGVNILSSWIGSPTATNTLSGTSMSTPHVAGLACYLIALEGLKTPAAIVARIKALATSGVVTGAGAGSPNLLAYNGSGL